MDTSDTGNKTPPGVAPVDPATSTTDDGHQDQGTAGLHGEGKRLRPNLNTNTYICKNRNSAENPQNPVGNPILVEYPDSSSPDARSFDSDSRISDFDSPGPRNAGQSSQRGGSDQDSDGDIWMGSKSRGQNPKPNSGSAPDSVDSKSKGQELKSISSGLASDSGYKTPQNSRKSLDGQESNLISSGSAPDSGQKTPKNPKNPKKSRNPPSSPDLFESSSHDISDQNESHLEPDANATTEVSSGSESGLIPRSQSSPPSRIPVVRLQKLPQSSLTHTAKNLSTGPKPQEVVSRKRRGSRISRILSSSSSDSDSGFGTKLAPKTKAREVEREVEKGPAGTRGGKSKPKAAKLKPKMPEAKMVPPVSSSLDDFKIPKITEKSTKLETKRVSELQNFENRNKNPTKFASNLEKKPQFSRKNPVESRGRGRGRARPSSGVSYNNLMKNGFGLGRSTSRGPKTNEPHVSNKKPPKQASEKAPWKPPGKSSTPPPPPPPPRRILSAKRKESPPRPKTLKPKITQIKCQANLPPTRLQINRNSLSKNT